MIDMTYDREADAAYIKLGCGKVVESEEYGPFICDMDADGKIMAIEVLFVSQVLAPGPWQNAREPGSAVVVEQSADPVPPAQGG
jgi:uncharacterized protein YuzE